MVCQIGGLLLMKNKLYKYKDTIVRVLKESDQSVFIIDCLKTKMPYTVHKMDFKDAILCDEDLLMQETNEPVFDISEASERNKKIAYERYNMIAPLLSFMDNKYKRTSLINQIYEERNISKQTLRNYQHLQKKLVLHINYEYYQQPYLHWKQDLIQHFPDYHNLLPDQETERQAYY